MKNSQKLAILNQLDHFGRKMLKKLQTAKIGHSDSIQTTLVGKYWKSCKQPKLAILNQFRTLQYENTGKVAKQPNWPF